MGKIMRELSWTPVLKGRKFCSPACGRGCTKAEHDKATRDAAALCKLLGPGWQPHVWENLGWHYAAITADGTESGYIQVHPNLATFTVYLNTDGRTGGQWVVPDKDPKRGVRRAIRHAVEHVAVLREALEAVLDAVKNRSRIVEQGYRVGDERFDAEERPLARHTAAGRKVPLVRVRRVRFQPKARSR